MQQCIDALQLRFEHFLGILKKCQVEGFILACVQGWTVFNGQIHINFEREPKTQLFGIDLQSLQCKNNSNHCHLIFHVAKTQFHIFLSNNNRILGGVEVQKTKTIEVMF